MGKVILYKKPGCPKCSVLTMKLDKSEVEYEVIDDIEIMKEKGFLEAPKLEVDGVIMGFKEAVDWLKGQ